MRIAYDVAVTLSVFTICLLIGEMNGLPLRSWTRFAVGFFMLMLSLYVGNPDRYHTWQQIAQDSVFFILLGVGGVQAYSGLIQGAIELWNGAYLKWEKQPDKRPVALFAAVGASLRKTDMGILLFGVPFSLCLIFETLPPRSLRGQRRLWVG